MLQTIYWSGEYLQQVQTHWQVGVLESIEIGVSLYGKDNEESSNRRRVVKTINALEMISALVYTLLARVLILSNRVVLLVLFYGWLRMAIMVKVLQTKFRQLKGVALWLPPPSRLTPTKLLVQTKRILRGYLQDEDPNIASSTSLLELKDSKKILTVIKDRGGM